MSSNPKPQYIHVFLAYARKDTLLMKELEKHLVVLEHNQLIRIWYDEKINPGSKWDAEIKKQLDNADIILLLISSDFIASEYAYQQEMKKALRMEKKGKAKVFPVILRYCGWKRTPFAKLQVLPKDGEPVTSSFWHNYDIPLIQVLNVVDTTAQTIKAERIAIGNWDIEDESTLEPHILYNAFIKQADICFSAREWQNALKKYEQALSYYQVNDQSNSIFLQNRMETCRVEIGFAEKMILTQNALQSKNYAVALEYISEALQLKPDDEQASQILNKLREKEQQKLVTIQQWLILKKNSEILGKIC